MEGGVQRGKGNRMTSSPSIRKKQFLNLRVKKRGGGGKKRSRGKGRTSGWPKSKNLGQIA